MTLIVITTNLRTVKMKKIIMWLLILIVFGIITTCVSVRVGSPTHIDPHLIEVNDTIQ